MGSLLSSLLMQGRTGEPDREAFRPIQIGKILEEEDLVAETLQYVTKSLYRDKIYVADFYRELDQRVPEAAEEEEEQGDKGGIVWRMNVDHPLVYVLVADLGQQPIHIIDDVYGDIVVYADADVHEGIHHLVSACSSLGYTIYNEPEKDEPQEEEQQEKEVEDKKVV